MLDDSLHALHEVVGVPMIAVMNENPDTDGQRHPLIGIYYCPLNFREDHKNRAQAEYTVHGFREKCTYIVSPPLNLYVFEVELHLSAFF